MLHAAAPGYGRASAPVRGRRRHRRHPHQVAVADGWRARRRPAVRVLGRDGQGSVRPGPAGRPRLAPAAGVPRRPTTPRRWSDAPGSRLGTTACSRSTGTPSHRTRRTRTSSGTRSSRTCFREGGFWNGPHSATKMYLSRVPIDKFTEWPEYRTADGWSFAPEDAVPDRRSLLRREPDATAVSGRSVGLRHRRRRLLGRRRSRSTSPTSPGDRGRPSQYGPLVPRNADPKMNTYHAQPLPWRDEFGSVLITVSNNARNMRRDAWNNPHRYRPMVIYSPYAATPPTTTTTTTSTTVAPTTTRPTTTSTTHPRRRAPPRRRRRRSTTTPPTSTHHRPRRRPPSTTSTTTTTAPTTTTTAPRRRRCRPGVVDDARGCSQARGVACGA